MRVPNNSNPAVKGIDTQTVMVDSISELAGEAYEDFPSGTVMHVNVASTDATTLYQKQSDGSWVVASADEAALLALGYVKTFNGKIPASTIPGATTAQFLGDRTDYVYIPIVGQSLAQGNTNTAVITTTNPDADILTFAGGVKSLAGELGSFIPAVEDATAVWEGLPEAAQSREIGIVLAAKQILDFADDNSATRGPKYIVQTAGVSGARLDQLDKGDATEFYEDYFLPHLQAVGTVTTALGKTAEMPMVIFRQGESGSQPLSVAGWKARMTEYKDDIHGDGAANLSRQLPLKVLSYQTGGFGPSEVHAYAAIAQFELHREESWFMIGAPIYPIYGVGMLDGTIHLNSAGYAWQGAREGRIGAKWLYSGTKPATCTPQPPVVSGGVGSMDFDLETAPLVIDETTVDSVTNAGIKVVDVSGDLTTSKVRVAKFLTGERNRLRFNLNRAVGASGQIRIGLDYNYASSPVAGFGTNLRDSTADTVTISGVVRSLANWSPMGILNVPADVGTDFPCDHFYATVDGVDGYNDLQGSTNITEWDTTPVFTGEGNSVVITTDSELDTNILPTGSIDSAYVLVYLSPSYAVNTTQTATILNTRYGTLAGANGATMNLGKINVSGDLRYNAILTTWDGGVFQNTPLQIKSDYVGWALIGFSMDAVAGKVKVFCNPLAAQSAAFLEDSAGVDAYTPSAGQTLQIGRANYVQGGNSGIVNGSNIAAVGYANKYLDAADIAAVIAHAEAEFNITL